MFKVNEKVLFTKEDGVDMCNDVNVDGLVGTVLDGPFDSYIKGLSYYFVDFGVATEICYEGELSHVQTQPN